MNHYKYEVGAKVVWKKEIFSWEDIFFFRRIL